MCKNMIDLGGLFPQNNLVQLFHFKKTVIKAQRAQALSDRLHWWPRGTHPGAPSFYPRSICAFPSAFVFSDVDGLQLESCQR